MILSPLSIYYVVATALVADVVDPVPIDRLARGWIHGLITYFHCGNSRVRILRLKFSKRYAMELYS